MKILEIHGFITKIMKIIKKQCENQDNHETLRILYENHKTHENHRNPCENFKNHENHKIPKDNF